MVLLNCTACNKTFSVLPYRKDTARYCSSKCYWNNKHDVPWNKGLKTGLVPKSAFKKGSVPWSKGKLLSDNVKLKISQSRSGKSRGEKHWNWQGGKPKSNRRETMTYDEHRKYLDWQKAVFTRDMWNCQFCGKHGGVLHADHIKSWALYPKLRHKVSNGRTLCPPCHQKTFSYGRHVKHLLQST